MEYILVFDVGTTAVKASLFSKALSYVGSHVCEYELLTMQDNRVELPANVYVENACEALSGLFSETGADKEEISSIVITTQGETLIPVDDHGNPLANAIVWIDNRAEKEAEELLDKLSLNKIDAAHFYKVTGVTELNGYCPISKILWIKENNPDTYEKTHKFLLLEDYLIYKLTGRFVSEKSILSTTGYFDILNDCIWNEIIDIAGIKRSLIPDALECGEIVSNVNPEAAKTFGLSEKTMVFTAAMDQVCAALGSGNINEGIFSETTGTAMCIGTSVSRTPTENDEKIIVYRHYRRGLYLIIPICMSAGLILKWFKDEFCAKESLEAEKMGISVYDHLSRLAEDVPPMSEGLVMIPYFTGTLQPDYNPDAKGVFYGVSLHTKKKHFVRAIFEGVGYMLRENIEFIERISGIKAREVRALGGGSNSRLWMQIKADITGLNMIPMAGYEASAFGAAILAAGSEAIENLEVFKQGFQVICPNNENVDRYKKGFKLYCDLYKSVKGLKE